MIPKDVAERRGFGVLDGSSNSHEDLIARLRTLLPSAIAEDGRVDVNAILKSVGGGGEGARDNNQKYELRFAGKGLANYLADSSTETELRVELGQSKSFDSTSNVIIRGDNLDVLKILRRNYYGMIKTIYIDPPYNTEKDDFVYNDDFRSNEKELIEKLGLDTETVERFHNLYGDKTHSGWLAFMYPRLKVARDPAC